MAETNHYGIRDFEPTGRFENTGFGLGARIPSTFHHTDAWHIEKIKTDGSHTLTGIMVIEKRVVGFTVAITVGTHEGNGFILGNIILDIRNTIQRSCRILVVVAYQHHGIVVNSTVLYNAQGINGTIITRYFIIHRLFIKGSWTIACHGDTIFGSTTISHIIIGIAEVSRLSPIGFNGDGSHSIRHFPIGTLAKDATTHNIEILVGTGAIHKVPVRGIVRCGSEIASTRSATIDFDNLPTCHHTIMGVVARTNLVIVRQLHFLVVEVVRIRIIVVVMVKILVGDIKGKLSRSDRRILVIVKILSSGTLLYVHYKRTQLTALVIMFIVRINRHSMFSIVIDNGRIIAWSLQYGIRGDALVQHPFGNQISFSSMTADVVGCHVACRVER